MTDPEIDGYLRRLRDFGQYEKSRGDVDLPGLNSKMTEVCALVGLRNLAKAGEILQRRAANAEKYRQFFGGLEKQGLLKTMRVRPEVHCPYLYYPIILNEEAGPFVEHMKKHDIAVRRYYTATHDLKFYRGRYRNQDLSFTNAIKDNLVSLPIHTVMSSREYNHLFNAVAKYFRG